MTKLALALVLAASGHAGSGALVAGSKHDLSITGPGKLRATSETNPCVFCHVAHLGVSNRPDPGAIHRPYESSTMAGRPAAPTAASRICLSCHDGTIAVGETRTRHIPTTSGAIPSESPANLGTDLRRTHPVSFRPVPGRQAHAPRGGDGVKLDASGQVQCTSCHDPHREFLVAAEGKFLVRATRNSELCLACHDGLSFGAAGAGHATSGARFGVAEGNDGPYATVAEAGCLACHVTHGAAVEGRLLPKPGGDDDACLRCHASSVTRLSIGRDMAKPYAHAGTERGVHDAAEGRPQSQRHLPERSSGAARHVSCVDCHDPHAATSRAASEPGGASGALAGVWGIDRNGQRVEPVQYEYEVCFKCHADSANKPQAHGPRPPDTVRRAVTDANLRRVLDPAAPSFHPVVATGKSADVPGLKAPYTVASRIACSDCHASDEGPGAGGIRARGPHGSAYPHLLERSYSTTDYASESPAAYALCYKCHDREVLLATEPSPARQASRFPLHAQHLAGPKPTPCSTCHAAHGVSAQAGTADANAHLVDFDVSIVRPGSGGLRRYQTLGVGAGSCTLSCHDHDHDPASRRGEYGALAARAPSTSFLRAAPAWSATVRGKPAGRAR
jgi:predicted CXXCH cytochrome family protein